jgi:hypothetical protein
MATPPLELVLTQPVADAWLQEQDEQEGLPTPIRDLGQAFAEWRGEMLSSNYGEPPSDQW